MTSDEAGSSYFFAILLNGGRVNAHGQLLLYLFDAILNDEASDAVSGREDAHKSPFRCFCHFFFKCFFQIELIPLVFQGF